MLENSAYSYNVMDKLKIIQLNCQRSYDVMCDLGEILVQRKVSVALLQEPMVQCNKVMGLPVGFKIFVSNDGKSAIVVCDPMIESIMINKAKNAMGIAVYIRGAFGELYLSSLYCRPSVPIGPYLKYIKRITEIGHGKPLLIGMDANATSSCWHSKNIRLTSNSAHRGTELAEFLLRHELSVLNEPSDFSTFSGPAGVSDIDVTVVNEAANVYGFDWCILEGLGISDHSVIEINLGFKVNNAVVPSLRWSTTDVDWKEYMEAVKLKVNDINLNIYEGWCIDDKVNWLETTFHSVNNELLKKMTRRRIKRIKWWNDELEGMKRRLKHYRRNFQRARRNRESNVQQLRIVYIDFLKDYKKSLRVAKESDWKAFVEQYADEPWGAVYKICRNRQERNFICSLKSGSTSTATWSESVDVLLETFFPGAEPFVDIPASAPQCTRDFTVNEVEVSVMSTRSRKSPGMDGITGAMLKCGWIVLAEFICKLFNQCMHEGYFPNKWKEADVVILLKSGNRVKDNPRSYRPISLLPVLGKALERLMVSRLEEKVEVGLSDRQYGFRKGKSAEDAWWDVVSMVDGSTKKYVLGIFVDFQGAFDNLLWDCVVRRINIAECEELELWKSYFRNRKACVRGYENKWCDVSKGCPQGSICGPYIWNLMMDELLKNLSISGKVCAFADDLLLIIEGDSRLQLEQSGNVIMNIVSEWGSKVGVSVSKDKTVQMLLKGILSVGTPPRIRLNGAAIKYVTETKYLGVHLSERMNFGIHVNKLKDKMLVAVGSLSRVMRKEWGLTRTSVRTIYKGLLVPSVSYAASVWGEVVSRAVGLKKINGVQRTALYAGIGVCKTVSVDAMQVLFGVPPLDLTIRALGTTYRYKKNLPMMNHDLLDNDEIGRVENMKEYKKLVDEKIISKWQDRWDDSQNGRILFEYIKNVTFAIGNKHFNPSVYVLFLLTGHGSMNGFLESRGLSESAECDCSYAQEDWKHILVDCAYYNEFRDLNAMGVEIANGLVDVSKVLESRESFEAFCLFANRAFAERKNRHRVNQE